MSFSIAYAGNGNFTMTVDGKTQTFNLADLNTMLRMEQVEQYDTQIADQLKEIQATNMKRKQLNQLLSKMRQAKAEGRDDDGNESSWDGKGSLTFKLDGTDGTTRNLQGWMQYFGLTCVDVSCAGDQKTRDTNWDTNITAVKGLIDDITSDSEMQMLRFRQLVDKRGTALQEAKTTLTNDKRLKDTITQG
jgi:hypothetical protein